MDINIQDFSILLQFSAVSSIMSFGDALTKASTWPIIIAPQASSFGLSVGLGTSPQILPSLFAWTNVVLPVLLGLMTPAPAVGPHGGDIYLKKHLSFCFFSSFECLVLFSLNIRIDALFSFRVGPPASVSVQLLSSVLTA
jgi:hypothetical protein